MRLTCLGECLAPAIRNGTVIEAEATSPENLRPGDLAVFTLALSIRATGFCSGAKRTVSGGTS
jgi:hypothetical protein